MKEMIRQIFNEVMKQDDCTPETWRIIHIKVMKLEISTQFALCQRCKNCSQHFQTTDSIPDLTVCNRRTREGFDIHTKRWIILQHADCLSRSARSGVRVATVDFMKAFDSISHKSLWKALEHFGIEPQHISLLKGLFAEQKGTVLTDTERDVFETKRRTKQGDPLTSLLFNTVLQMALKDDVTRWQKLQGMGTCLGGSESHCFANLRSADDVLLFSTSLEQLQKMMMGDFKQSTERERLKIHPDKTKILSNHSSNRRKVAISNIKL